MKASHEIIFLYNIPDDESGKKLKGVCFRMGIRVREITPDQFHHPLGYLAGLPGFEAAQDSTVNRTFSEAMLVMKQFTSKRMDELFRQWRKIWGSADSFKSSDDISECAVGFCHIV